MCQFFFLKSCVALKLRKVWPKHIDFYVGHQLQSDSRNFGHFTQKKCVKSMPLAEIRNLFSSLCRMLLPAFFLLSPVSARSFLFSLPLAILFFPLAILSWRRKWQPTPVFLPGESQGQGSLVGCCLWGRTVRHD